MGIKAFERSVTQNVHSSFGVWLTNTSVALARERTIPTERPPLVSEVSVNFRGLRVSLGQRNGSPLSYSLFLYRSSCYFFRVAYQLYSRGWVDPVPYPLLLRKSGSGENRSRTFGSVDKNSDH
jgi:hypothetical protein